MTRDVFSPDGHAALLFDMDGTVLTSIAAAERVWTRWARDHGLDPAVFLPTIHGKRAIDSVRDSGVADIDVDAEAQAILEAEVADVAGIEPIAGAPAFLSGLPAGRWAIVTSAPRRLAEARIAAAGLPMPDVLVSGDDVERGKPAPDAFLIGADRLGVAADDCVVFEDAEAGIGAAEAAGAAVVVITANHAAAEHPTHPRLTGYEGLAVEMLDSDRIRLHRP